MIIERSQIKNHNSEKLDDVMLLDVELRQDSLNQIFREALVAGKSALVKIMDVNLILKLIGLELLR